ncbi:transcript variant X2, partial [Nothobranchius furzeri]
MLLGFMTAAAAQRQCPLASTALYSCLFMDSFSLTTPVKTPKMGVSLADQFVWVTVVVCLFVPRLSVGLLSDYKICGDPECESLMSRVQAIKEHHGEDCRFLSFRRGEIIFVYHKLTGKRDDLWAGSIDKQFGYFPKDAVREEQVYATTEKVVETQKSDFFCMDESGYPVDAAYLDYDDPSAESVVEEQIAKEDKPLRDAAEPLEEAQETSAAQEEQGGSASSAWLGSSVTGWFQLPKEEPSGNQEEGEKEDETKADAYITSSVTGWLGFGGDLKPDETKESVTPKEDSLTSAMTGWLSFGGQKETDSTKDERRGETEPTETFRGRRMSLDLEGSELHEEEKDMGTLGWLGRGLSSRLGFGQNKPDPGRDAKSGGEGGDEKERTKFWMDVGIGGILGLGEEKGEESDVEELESYKSVEQTDGSDSGENSESKVLLADEIKMESSSSTLEPTRVPHPEPIRDDRYHDMYAVRRESSILDVEPEDVSPPAETSSNDVFRTNDNNLKDDIQSYEDSFVETEAGVSQVFHSLENVKEAQTKEPVENIINFTNNNQDFLARSNSKEPDGLRSNSTKPSEREDETNQMQSRAAGAEITNTADRLKESHREEELFNEAINLPQRGVFSPRTEESAEESRLSRDEKEQERLLLMSQEREDKTPSQEGFTSTEITNSDDAKAPDAKAEIHRGELEPTEGISQEVGLLYSGGKNPERLYENASAEDRGMTIPNKTPDTNQTLESPTLSNKLEEAVRDQDDETRKEVLGSREDALSLNNLKSTLGLKTTGKWENEANTGMKEKGEEKTKEGNEGNEEVEEEEQLREVEGMNKNEKTHVDGKIKEEEVEEEKDELKGEVSGKEEELKEEEKHVREVEVERCEEASEKDKNEGEKQVEGRELEKSQRDVWRPDLESNKNQTPDNSSPSVSESVSWTEHIKTGEQEEEKKREFDKVKDGKMEEDSVEKQHMMASQSFSQENRVAAVVGEAGSSKDGGSSAGGAVAGTGGQADDSADGKASDNTVGENDEEERKTDDATDSSESDGDGEELSTHAHESVESLVQSPEQSTSEDSADSSRPSESAGTESSGAFGLFRNPFGFFSQTPNPAAAASTQNLQRVSTESAESEPQASEPEFTSATIPPNQAQLMHSVPYPTAAESTHHSAPSTAETAPKAKTLTKQYQNLLVHMNVDETDVLFELFGRHKLQFLDYILASSEAVPTGDDLSILSDIEGLLHHHTETLVAPSMRLTEAPQEDKDKTRTLIALQKLEMLLKTIKDSFSMRISDVSKHQGEEKKELSQDSPATKDKSNYTGEQMTDGATKEKKKNVAEGRKDTRREGGTFQEGLKTQTSDFRHKVTKDSNVLTWLTVQVVSLLPDDMQPGSDLYGAPWEPVIITGLVGLMTCLLFTCRCYISVSAQLYLLKERWMSEQIAQLLDEKCKVLETLSQCQQE